MKRTKRQETSIIIYFSFYVLLSLCLLSYYIFSLVPWVKQIEELKTNTYEIYTKYQSIETKGLSFDEFKKISWTSNLNTYSKELVQSLDIQFYNKYFLNKSETSYDQFIDEQNKKITQWDNYENFLNKSQEISKILPIYTEINMGKNEEYLSDFEFIHYIESILKTFNLEYSNEIWVSELVLVEEFSNSENKSKLDTNIFYVPVKFDIKWSKSDIINFLYFIEHVWNTSILNDGITIEDQDENKFLYRSSKVLGQKIILDGADITSRLDYNIFQNQFIDFESIEFNEFIDDQRSRVSKSQDLISRIKKDQANDKYTIKVGLRFYVKWVQNLKIINQINDYLTYYQATKKIFTQLKSTKTTPPNILPILNDVIQIQSELEKEQKIINQSVTKQENLLQTLKEVSEYTEILHKLHGKIWYNYYIIDVLNTVNKIQSIENLETTNKELFTYLTQIEETLSGLEKFEQETNQQYQNRLNNRNIFTTVLQIEKSINNLK